MNIKKFKNIEVLNFCGDIHGDFGTLDYQIENRFKMENSLTVVCGDIGMGFCKPNYYKKQFDEINKELERGNNHVIFFRGNHDDPTYFNIPEKAEEFSTEFIHLIPDYTMLEVSYERDVPDDGINNRSGFLLVLCIGGGLSIDRTYRIQNDIHNKRYGKTDVATYWEDEFPVFLPDKIDEFVKHYGYNDEIFEPIILATHSSPKWCQPVDKGQMLMGWVTEDSMVLEDSTRERQVVTDIHEYLRQKCINLQANYYGHFHHSYYDNIDGIKCYGLNINEIKEHKLL
jgi:hypothetical protein